MKSEPKQQQVSYNYLTFISIRVKLSYITASVTFEVYSDSSTDLVWDKKKSLYGGLSIDKFTKFTSHSFLIPAHCNVSYNYLTFISIRVKLSYITASVKLIKYLKGNNTLCEYYVTVITTYAIALINVPHFIMLFFYWQVHVLLKSLQIVPLI
jgi:hypothetical protein